MNEPMPCPCGSGKHYNDCCEPLIRGTQAAASPEALMRRIEWARAVSRFLQRHTDPQKLIADTIAPVAGAEVAALITSAPSPDEGIALVLASAEFQRR